MKTNIKKESRKAVGAAENNRNEVRELVDDVIQVNDSEYILVDKASNEIYVNIDTGVTGRVTGIMNSLNGVIVSYDSFETGATSRKANGYVYTPLVIQNTKGELSTTNYGTHSFVAMIAYTELYDEMVADGKRPVVNHINNRPWDNRMVNLEWSTQGGNNRHGKIVASLHHYYKGSEYTHIENNMGTVDFIVLNKPLPILYIETFVNYVGDGAVFSCGHDEYIDLNVIEEFVSFLERNTNWGMCTV